MSRYLWVRAALAWILIVQAFFLGSSPALASPLQSIGGAEQALEFSRTGSLGPLDPAVSLSSLQLTRAAGFGLAGNGAASIQAAPVGPTTTLAVSIISSPWAVLDHNDPTGGGGEVPQVLVVAAVVTNTGTVTATDLSVLLDYSEAPAQNWVLLPGEDPERTLDELAPQATYYVYWFARYSTVIGASHQYSVTAEAANANPVSTSENSYGELAVGETVKTRAFLSTGNSGIVQTSAEVVVGVVFTVTVQYDLGSSPQGLILNPAGNLDFAPDAYRLIGSTVRLYNDAGTEEQVLTDRLYLPTLPPFAQNAEAVYTFIPFTPQNTRLCPYTAVDFKSTDKYDQFFCSESAGTTVPVTGTVSLSLEKTTSSDAIQQGQLLTYTIRYTNDGDLPLLYAWIWDDVDSAIGSIASSSIQPPGDPVETTGSRVAWYLGTVPPSGQPGNAGTLTFAIRVDGNGQDLPDGTLAVNDALWGINPGSLPPKPALTSTVTTTIQAPTLTVTKTDAHTTAQPGEALTYTVRITNSGTVAATSLVVTDTLPPSVSLAGPISPAPDVEAGQVLVWNSLGSLPPGGGAVLSLPVAVAPILPNGTILTNSVEVSYGNGVGYAFVPQAALDVTLVEAPILNISKAGHPDPVLAGNLLTYTLYYTNSGPASATNVVVTDVVPISTTYQGPCMGGVSCGESGGVVSWTLGTLGANSSGSVRFSVVVSDVVETGNTIVNDGYGLIADQTGFISESAVSTLVNRDAAVFDGYTFLDDDGDGVYDGGESPLSGVAITITGASSAITTTDGAGYFRLRIENPGPVSIAAGLPAGYFRTTPGTVLTDSVLGITQTVNFGYSPVTASYGVLYGTVFEDADHDSTWDLGEHGIAGATVESDDASNSPISTNEFGQYTLRYDTSGSVVLTETNPLGYVSTTPDVVPASVVTRSSGSSPVDFGDFAGIRITGQVFDDVNVNGTNDGESGVSGASVAADGDHYTTDSSGVYTLYVGVSSNPILIQETDPVSYVSTNALPGTDMSRVDANSLLIASPVSGTAYSGSFGDVLASSAVTITGYVWEDNGAGAGIAADGVWDVPDEPGLAGAVVQLSTGLTQTTGASGAFALYGPPNEGITITEVNPAGYASTNAVPGTGASKVDNDALLLSSLAGGSTSDDNLFGDVLLSNVAIITGTVYDDQDEDGVVDGGEAGLSGVSVVLEINGGNTITVPTNAGGLYQFAVMPGTDVRITSGGPGGAYYPTTPESVVVRPPATGSFPNNNFGYSDDSDVQVVYGLVFDDTDSDGELEFGELGLAGAAITLNGGDLVTTTGNGLITGTFTFAIAQPGLYALQETNPAGYRSTTPDHLNLQVNLDQSYYVEFGDTDSGATASIYGIAFDDANSNGLRDPAEPGLPGVVISVSVSGGVLTTTTKLYGQYTYGFEIAETGAHSVRERDPALPGYRSTTPDQVNLYVVVGQSYIVNFGDTTDGYSTIMGTVFDDISGDGIQDPGELGIEGVTVSLSDGQTTATGSHGRYSFAISDAGLLQVAETDPSGYHSTTPNTVTVNVELSQVYLVNFGDSDNAFAASFFGTVFEDRDGDGARDLGEPSLSGVTVTMGGAAAPFLTNQWGQFTFLIGDTGIYTATEIDPPGYASTVAVPGSGAVTWVDNNTLRAQIDSLGVDLGDNLFGDVQAGPTTLALAKSATDVDGPPLVVSDTIHYTLQVTNTGTYTAYGVVVTDDLPDLVTCQAVSGDSSPTGCADPFAWAIPSLAPEDIATLHITATIDLAGLGQTITNTGLVTGSNVPDPPDPPPSVCPDGSPEPCQVTPGYAALYGGVFDDSSGDGVWNVGEVGIPGVLLTLDGAVTTTTDPDGLYTLVVITGGSHTLVETDPEGYQSTTPNAVTVTLAAGQHYRVDFGDTTGEVCDCAADAYEEDDTAGQAQPLSVGELQSHDFCDDASDWMTFSAQAGAVYTITTRSWGQRADTFLALYGTDASTMLSANDDYEGSTDYSSRIVWQAPADGLYYVRVTNRAGLTGCNTAYDVTLERGEPQEMGQIYLPLILRVYPSVGGAAIEPTGVISHTCPDAYEPDDTWQQAQPIVDGVPQGHSFDSNPQQYAADKDYVRFDAQTGQTITFTVVAVTGTSTLLELYDANGIALDITGATQVVWMAGQAGRYYLSVSPQTAAFGCADAVGYTLRMEAEPYERRVTYLPLVLRVHTP